MSVWHSKAKPVSLAAKYVFVSPYSLFLIKDTQQEQVSSHGTKNTNRTSTNTTMSTSINPMYHLRHAWDATHSIWGKLCIVLFYLFIWLQIIWAIELILFPTLGWECVSDGMSEYAHRCYVMLLRVMNLFTLGFYLYADRGGIRVWNVTMVFVFNLGFTWASLDWIANYSNLEGAPEGCEDTMAGMKVSIWVLFVWSLVALLCSGMEKAASPSGSSSETTPLNA